MTSIIELSKITDYPIISNILTQEPDFLNNKNENGMMLIHHAAFNDNTTLIKFINDNGGNINMPNIYGWTPIICACRNGNINSILLLLQLDADIYCNHVNIIKDNNFSESELPYKWSVLHEAVYSNHLHIVKFLHQYGIDINILNGDGETPLHIACNTDRNNSIEVVKFLLENNAGYSINQITLYGDTALHYACKNNQLEIVKLLIDYGAKLYVTNNFNEKPLDLMSNTIIKNDIKKYFSLKRTINYLSN